MEICFATHNPNKVREINQLVHGDYTVYGLEKLGVIEDIPETGDTLEENASLKARYVHERFGVAVFSDDSGLLVDALNGEPGVFSARYAGEAKDDQQNMSLLLKNLDGASSRKAHFKTVISFIDKKGHERQFVGHAFGTITKEKRGANGFGYDPIFQPNGFDHTFAELSAETKNSISHRAIAFRQLLAFFNQVHG